MAKFDRMEFGYDAGSFDMLVFHAKKYSKQEASELFNRQYRCRGKIASPERVRDGFVKYYIRPNQFMSGDIDGGCYGFCEAKERGAFPVLIIELCDLPYESEF